MRIRSGLFLLCLLVLFPASTRVWALTAPQGEAAWQFARPEFTAVALPAAATPPRSQPREKYSQPSSVTGGSKPFSSTREDLFRLMAGGILGGWLWSLIFGYPAPSWPEGSWPLGLLDFLVIAALVYLGYRVLKRAWEKEAAPPATADRCFLRPQTISPVNLDVNGDALPGLDQIMASDPDFNLAGFGEYARQVIAEFYTAWNRQDLEPLKELVTEKMFHLLSVAFKVLKMRDEISRLEDLLLNSLEVTAAAQDDQKEFITLRLQGLVLDYILQRHSLKLLSGSLTYQAELTEYWHFERQRGQKAWKLGNIEEP
ncbi:MAG: TIM44-like domain-containing protein [Thermodesulfobacteriota bacterium]